MKATLLPDRGVIKVTGDVARKFLHGLVTVDMLALTPGTARFCALLTPQGKIITDFFVAEAPPAEGGGFFLDVPRALAATLVEKLNLYKLRAKVLIEDLSEILGVLAAWDGQHTTKDYTTKYGLVYADPRLPALGLRIMIAPHQAGQAAAELGADLVAAEDHEAHRIALGIPRGGVDFAKGCYVGQEVVSRIEHRGIARSRAVPIRYDGAQPENGAPVTAGERQVGTMGSAAGGLGIALLRLDRVAEAAEPLKAGGVPIHVIKPDWARFSLPQESKIAE